MSATIEKKTKKTKKLKAKRLKACVTFEQMQLPSGTVPIYHYRVVELANVLRPAIGDTLDKIQVEKMIEAGQRVRIVEAPCRA